MDNGASSYRRFIFGDDDSFIDIIREYKDPLILYLNTFTNNISVAEDLAEDTFVKLVIKKPRFAGKSSFKTWLYAIGRNVAIDYLKKEGKIKKLPLEDLLELKNEDADLERELLKEEAGRKLHMELKRLPIEYRQVLWLRYFDGLTNKEISEVMKKSIHNVETLIYRAKNALKKQLEKEKFVYEDLR